MSNIRCGFQFLSLYLITVTLTFTFKYVFVHFFIAGLAPAASCTTGQCVTHASCTATVCECDAGYTATASMCKFKLNCNTLAPLDPNWLISLLHLAFYLVISMIYNLSS